MVRTSWRCWRKGHDWFPPIEQREYLPTVSRCMRCQTVHVALPTADCIRGHPLAEHYDELGHLTPHPTCPGPA